MAGKKHIPIELWGKDHYSLLAYIHDVCVNYGGVPDFRRMRINEERHPQFANPIAVEVVDGGKECPTILKNGLKVNNHDDWDCAEDLESEGLVVIEGTGINPVFKLTQKGLEVVNKLLEHKLKGGTFSNFVVMVYGR